MKRTKLFGLMMALVVGMGFTSCSDDEDLSGDHITIVPSANNPSTAYVGTPFDIEFTVALLDNRISEVDVRTGNLSVAGYPKTKFDDNKTNLLKFTHEPKEAEVGELTFTIIAKDNKGAENFAPVKITIKKQPAAIESFTAVLMGSYDDANLGSFFSTVTGKVYKITPAGADSELIDFAYFYGSTNEATISAPDNDDVFGTGDGKVFGPVTSWAKRQETRFTKISAENLTVAKFDAAENDEIITENEAEAEELRKMVNKLQDGDLVFFVTADGKKGIFKVAELDTEAKTITIDVKVQK